MFVRGFIVGCILTLAIGAYTIHKKSKELARELKNEEINKEN